MEQELEFLTFEPALAPHFKRINQEWIEEMFSLEDGDRAILNEPQAKIIDSGGQIWFARHAQLGIVGCCAVMHKGEGAFELTKMGVLKNTRGLKLGERLLRHVLKSAKQLPIERLFLLTSNHCEAAIHLYLKNGFEHDAGVLQTYGSTYERCDVGMKYPPIWHER